MTAIAAARAAGHGDDMPNDYYFDESGNTGDLALAAPGFAFSGQPVFTLASIGVDNLAGLESELDRLRRLHKVGGAELKFDAVRRKPRFVLDLLDYLVANNLPVLAEVTDKRFAICCQIVETLIAPASGPQDYGTRARLIKNVVADRLYHEAPDRVLCAFARACREATNAASRAAFCALLEWIDGAPRDEVYAGLQLFTRDTFREFEEEGEGAGGASRNRPAPDRLRSGKLVWMLPHVPSLLNLYARINLAHRRQLGEVRFFHDEQVQFETALREAMGLAEGPIGMDLPHLPFADFRIEHAVPLTFEISQKNVAIQAADLIAGTLSFCVRTLTAGESSLSEDWRRALRALFDLAEHAPPSGVNFVVPTDMHADIMGRVYVG